MVFIMLNIDDILFACRDTELIIPDKPVIFYGAGKSCFDVLEFYEKRNIYPIALCDSNPDKIGKDIYGYQVMSLQDAVNEFGSFCVVITVFDKKLRKEIRETISKSIPEEDIIDIDIDEDFQRLKYKDVISRNNEKLFEIYQALEDEISRNVLKLVLKGYLSHDNSYFYEACCAEKQYFNELTREGERGIFIDAGACEGDTIIDYYRFTNGKFSKIHAFEPFNECFETLVQMKEQKYSNDERIVLHKSGLYETTGKIGFDDNSQIGSTKIDTGIHSKTIDVLKLDDLKLDNVTFIKMDIEGSELSALKGARETIIRNKPKLAVSIYHKPGDIIEIPEFIMGLSLNYKYYIRHHGNVNPEYIRCETVFYAV